LSISVAFELVLPLAAAVTSPFVAVAAAAEPLQQIPVAAHSTLP
jgi:hypothetical protein